MNITSPVGAQKSKLLDSLESALIKPEDVNLPRLRHQGPSQEKSLALERYNEARESRRKQAFSSDDEDEKPDTLPYERATPEVYNTHSGHNEGTEYIESRADEASQHNEANEYSEQHVSDHFTEHQLQDEEVEENLTKRENADSVVPEQPKKRKRGRPRKTETEKKEKVATRRSRRIVENPTLRKIHAQEPLLHSLGPKPLRTVGLTQFGHLDGIASEITLLSKGNKGKQKPLIIDAERLHTASSRDRRFNLTTLDVLRQFVDEYAPKGAKNEIVNEATVLNEFKAHLIYHIEHLMDLHASIRDISNDIADIQRRKNQVRRNMLELKQKHANVGSELTKTRKEYNDSKQEHSEFSSMIESLSKLKNAVAGPQTQMGNLSDKVMMDLDDVSRIYHPQHGLQMQLQRINARLAQMTNP